MNLRSQRSQSKRVIITIPMLQTWGNFTFCKKIIRIHSYYSLWSFFRMQKYLIAVCVLWLLATATVSFGWSICHQNCETKFLGLLRIGVQWGTSAGMCSRHALKLMAAIIDQGLWNQKRKANNQR